MSDRSAGQSVRDFATRIATEPAFRSFSDYLTDLILRLDGPSLAQLFRALNLGGPAFAEKIQQVAQALSVPVEAEAEVQPRPLERTSPTDPVFRPEDLSGESEVGSVWEREVRDAIPGTVRGTVQVGTREVPPEFGDGQPTLEPVLAPGLVSGAPLAAVLQARTLLDGWVADGLPEVFAREAHLRIDSAAQAYAHEGLGAEGLQSAVNDALYQDVRQSITSADGFTSEVTLSESPYSLLRRLKGDSQKDAKSAADQQLADNNARISGVNAKVAEATQEDVIAQVGSEADLAASLAATADIDAQFAAAAHAASIAADDARTRESNARTTLLDATTPIATTRAQVDLDTAIADRERADAEASVATATARAQISRAGSLARTSAADAQRAEATLALEQGAMIQTIVEADFDERTRAQYRTLSSERDYQAVAQRVIDQYTLIGNRRDLRTSGARLTPEQVVQTFIGLVGPNIAPDIRRKIEADLRASVAYRGLVREPSRPNAPAPPVAAPPPAAAPRQEFEVPAGF